MTDEAGLSSLAIDSAGLSTAGEDEATADGEADWEAEEAVAADGDDVAAAVAAAACPSPSACRARAFRLRFGPPAVMAETGYAQSRLAIVQLAHAGFCSSHCAALGAPGQRQYVPLV